MNIYRIWRADGNVEYDEYDSAIVIAEDSLKASLMHPNGQEILKFGQDHPNAWVRPEDVSVRKIGVSGEGETAGVVCSSFNAG